jgi:UDP-N-acetylglucosamine--N-acetylmuramyl-(pentapeptide) pyrophosphoryl-undecaprenol N-acetylglucosamine transferase
VIPGATNRLLGRFVKKIAVSFPETASAFKKPVTVTGNPVRAEFAGISSRVEKEKFHILLFGGSRGAAALNRAMIRALPLLRACGEQIQLTIQTGEKDFEMVSEAFKATGIPGQVTPFITDMAKKMESADLLVCRAGATTLAEVTAAGRAAILVPFPMAVQNHQEINARALEKKGGARVIPEKDLTGEKLADEILDLLRSPEKLRSMETAGRSAEGGRAAGVISEILKTLASGNRRTA